MLTVITLDIFSEEGSSLYFFFSQFRQSPLTLIKSVLYHMISLPWTKLRQHSVFIYPHVQCFPRKVVIPNPFSCLALSFFYHMLWWGFCHPALHTSPWRWGFISRVAKTLPLLCLPTSRTKSIHIETKDSNNKHDFNNKVSQFRQTSSNTLLSDRILP